MVTSFYALILCITFRYRLPICTNTYLNLIPKRKESSPVADVSVVGIRSESKDMSIVFHSSSSASSVTNPTWMLDLMAYKPNKLCIRSSTLILHVIADSFFDIFILRTRFPVVLFTDIMSINSWITLYIASKVNSDGYRSMQVSKT